MAINEHDNLVIRKKVQVIQQLIRNSKDAKLQRQLEGILQDQERLFGTRKTYANAASIRKQKDEFLADLDTFKRWVFKRIAKNTAIRTPKVTIPKLKESDIQMSLGSHQLSSSKNNEPSDSEEEIFTPVTKNGTAASDLGKRVRKPFIRPDFVSTLKKPKMEVEQQMEVEEEDQGGTSSTEGDSSTSSKFNPSGTIGSNGLPEFPCPVCRKIFRKKGHMTRHLLTHEPEKPFGCDLCPKRFAAKYSLQMHLLNRHNTDAKPFECEIKGCDRRFTLKKELDQHARSHADGFKPKSYPCAHCELKFITQGDLDSHVEMSHPEVEPFNCSSCEKTFPRRYNLIRHERTHSTDKQYHCCICNKDFGTKNGLQMHLQAHELEDKEKCLSCHLCSKKFAVEQNLEIHISFHSQSEEKPYSCELCEVRFKSQERLDKHIDTHGSSEGRVYHCQYCEKIFPRKYNLLRHELSHTHGRRKPKEGLPIPLPRVLEQRERIREMNANRHNTTISTDEETYTFTSSSMSSTSIRYTENASTSNTCTFHKYEIPTLQDKHYKNVFLSKSDMYATLFKAYDEYDGISSPFSKKKYHILKFENY